MRTTDQGQLVAGRYRLEEQIGSGGMGVVWRAVDEELGRVVAVKRTARPAGDERARRQMRREARIAARLDHPHVVAFIDEVIEGPERWLVMEYVPSQSLAQILDRSGPLSPHQVTHLGRQIASALEAVHATDIVHRDVKPGNILVTEDGTAKLADFGISRPICGDVTVTDCGVIGGTVAFLASEVADGQEATPASDVFALGATLFAAVEGIPPFGNADNPLLVLRRAAAGDLLPFRRAGPLAPVLSALLQPDPAKRPDAASTRQMLQELAATSTGGQAPLPWPVGSARRPRRFRRRTIVTAGACVTALAAVAGLLVLRPDSPQVVLGDPRTADPCALMDPGTFTPFSNGTMSRETAYGNFNRCDYVVTGDGGTRTQVKVEFEKPAPLNGPMEKIGAFRVVKQPEKSGSCGWAVPLADQNLVLITTKQLPNHGPVANHPPPDLCPMAKAATDHVVDELGKGAIPRRIAPPDPKSLASMHACALLDSSTITRVLGPDASGPEAGIADWKCRWTSRNSGLTVRLAFDRNGPLTADDGRQDTFSGHDGRIGPEAGENNCRARVVYRSVHDGNEDPALELLKILVEGSQSPDQMCGPAEELAAAAAATLPPSQ
ncbi:MAG: serine/threonine-protein kinase [Pseudonocardiaceae bacterium]